MKKSNILIVGGGNVGHSLAFSLSNKANVSVLVRNKEKWNTQLLSNNDLSDTFNVFTWNDKGIPSPDIIFLTLPLLYRDEALNKLKILNIKCCTIIAIPGYGDFEGLISNSAFYKDFNYGSLQRVPYICRITEYGKEIKITGYKKELYLYLKKQDNDLLEHITYLFETPTFYLKSSLQNTLSNSNPLLHTSRLYSIFKNDLHLDKKSYFYEDWNDDCSMILIAMDDELKNIYIANGIKDLHNSILTHYGVKNAQELTQKIKSISAFKEIETPVRKLKENNYIADLQSRYFTEDFAIGLQCIYDIAQNSNVKLKTIPKILDWYNSIKNIEA